MGAWSRHQARNELQALGLAYSEASFIEQACKKNEPAVQLFLRAGMPVNVRGTYEVTALHCATQQVMPSLTALLISKGADVSARTNSGETPLLNAAKSASMEEIKALLAAGAPVNDADNYGNSPVLAAAGSQCGTPACRVEVVELLAAHGANVKARNQAGENAYSKLLQAAGGQDAEATLRALDKLSKLGFEPNALTADGATLISFAAGLGKQELLKKLIDAGADVNAKGKGPTALVAAIKWPDEVRLLLAAKADPNLQDGSGDSPVVVAARQQAYESLKILLDAGASPNPAPGKEGPLHVAAGLGDLDMATLLIQYPIDLDAKNGSGNSALHVLAANSGGDPPARVLIARLLIKAGATRDIPNQEGRKPADIALLANSMNLASALAGRRIVDNPLTDEPGVTPQKILVPTISR